MNSRVSRSSGRPGERKTSWTMGGAMFGEAAPVGERWSFLSFSSRQEVHSPPATVCWPQAHLRCNTGLFNDVVTDAPWKCCLVWLLIYLRLQPKTRCGMPLFGRGLGVLPGAEDDVPADSVGAGVDGAGRLGRPGVGMDPPARGRRRARTAAP